MIPDLGNLPLTIVVFIAALLVIVTIHEYGHYIVGRWCGIFAETFSLGFGPVIAKWTDRRGTQWQLAALPLGGYVKFLGDANAASVGGTAGARNTMLGAPLWARAATVVAGPMANFLLSALIFMAMFLIQGQVSDPLKIAQMKPLPASYAQGLQPGDEVLTAAGQEATTLAALYELSEDLPSTTSIQYQVLRDGDQITVDGPHPMPPLAGSISPRSAAHRAGLKPGDVITAIDGKQVATFADIRPMVDAGQGAPMTLTVWRDGDSFDVELQPKRTDLPTDDGFTTRYLIGLTSAPLFEPATETPGLWTVAKTSVTQVWQIIESSLSGLWHMATGAISTCNLSSPIGIADTAGAMAAQGASSYIYFIAFLSTAVGLLNLFPIPILDGGHLLFHAWEAVTGKPPSDGSLRIAMAIGLSLLLGLMTVALLNDLIFCR